MTSTTTSAPRVSIQQAPIQQAPTPRSAEDLLAAARRSLTEASISASPCERYSAAHLAALRAAAAVLAARSRPSKRPRVRSVWVVLPQVAAEFTEWADFFADVARKRAAAESGVNCVSHRAADDLVRDAEAFVARVAQYLGVPHQSSMVADLQHAG